jgi:hypothetical protein
MRRQLNVKLNRWTIAASGVGGLLLIAGLSIVPSLLAASLDSGQARKEIRQYLKWHLGLQQVAELQESGLALPTAEMAQHWKEQYAAIDRLEFAAVEIRRFPAPPFTTRRTFVAKVVCRDPEGHESTRYFSLSSKGKSFDVFLVAERSQWVGTLAF